MRKLDKLDISCDHKGDLDYWCEQCKPRLPCVWCGKSIDEHGPPGESEMGRPCDRLCPVPGVTSQFYTRPFPLAKMQPRIVCLCGSTRFGDAYRDAMRTETLAGKIVLSVGLLGHAEGLDMEGPIKKMLDELHLCKIDRTDEALFLNVGGYMGQSTLRELEYARSQRKVIRFLE